MNDSVLWMRLSVRTSSKGTEYLSGWNGVARVVGFKAKEPDKFGNEQWELFVQPPRQERPARDAARGVATGQALRERAERWQAPSDQLDDESPF